MRKILFVLFALGVAFPPAMAQEELTDKELSKLDDAKAAASDETAVPSPETPSTAAPVQPPTPAPDPQAKPVAGAETASGEPKLTPAPAAETSAPLSPLPVAIIKTVLDVCLPALRGEQALTDGLPPGATEGVDEETLGRFIARPREGDFWTISTLEGPMLLGNLDEREGACQVMGSTPLGEVVMDKVTSSLGSLDSPFTVSDETGDDFGTPIHWRRFISAERDYVDVLHYKGVPGGVASTIHVIVG
ncbi:MAG: hypothetical protein AAF829_10280 [Pseudomonadota bacterium]